MTDRWLTIGRVTRPRGLRGEFFFESSLERDLPRGVSLRVTPPGAEYPVETIADWDDRARLKLAGMDTIEAAEQIRGSELAVRRSAMGAELLLSDLVGCAVLDAASGREIGVVRDWRKNPGHPLLELESGMLIPFVEAFFPEIDATAGRILARLPEGLEDI